MKNPISGWLSAARLFVYKRLADAGRFFYGLFHIRPSLKRGVLAFCLCVAVAAPFAIVDLPAVAPAWAAMLATLFLGMGAERAALEWDDMFALPPIHTFAFWRWHALERKRFLAAIIGITLGVITASVIGAL